MSVMYQLLEERIKISTVVDWSDVPIGYKLEERIKISTVVDCYTSRNTEHSKRELKFLLL